MRLLVTTSSMQPKQGHTIAITGTVGGEFNTGDTVTITVNGNDLLLARSMQADSLASTYQAQH
jgi:hypothetical protein